MSTEATKEEAKTKTEAERITKEILDDLMNSILDNLCLSDHLHSAFVPYSLSQPSRNSILSQIPPFVTDDFQLLPTILKRDSPPLLQLQVLTQSNNDACGYFALHNAIIVYQALHCADLGLRNHFFGLLLSETSFWKVYFDCQAKLIQKAKVEGNKGWPWSIKSIQEGVMERSYLSYLLEKENEHFPSVHSTTVQFAYAHLTMTPSKLLELHDVFQNIAKADSICHIFFLGILSHWTCLLVTKSKGSLLMIYLDSLNRPSLNETDEFIENWVAEQERQREAKGKKPWSAFQREIAKQSRVDARLVLDLFSRCLSGENVVKITFNDAVLRFLASFKSFVCDVEEFEINEEENFDIFLSALEHWLENRWRPATLRDSFLHELQFFGPGVLYPDVMKQFIRWCEFQFTYEWKPLPIIPQFQSVVKRIYAVLKDPKFNKISRF